MLQIEISINIEIIIFLIIFIITKQIYVYLLFILFTLIHELSHMIVGITMGLKPQKFMIMPFGFKIVFNEYGEINKGELKQIIVSLSGPLSNIIIIIASFIFKWNLNIIYANLLIALFNLMPIYPLDGGRILKSILSIKLDNKKTYYLINKISNITIIILTALASIIILYIHNLSIVCVLGYLWYIVIRENKKYNFIKKVYGIIEETVN